MTRRQHAHEQTGGIFSWQEAGFVLALLAAIASGPGHAQVTGNPSVDATLPMPAREGADPERTRQRILDLTNAFRSGLGVDDVAVDENLQRAAQEYAQYLARNHQVGHTADGRQPDQRAGAAGYRHCVLRENVGYLYDGRGFDTGSLARGILAGWQGSPGHRENLVAPHVVDAGIGVARSERTGAWFAVQLLGRPRSLAFRLSVVNDTGARVSYTLSDGGEGPEMFTARPGQVDEHERCVPLRMTYRQGNDEHVVQVSADQVVRLTASGRIHADPRSLTLAQAGVDSRGGAGLVPPADATTGPRRSAPSTPEPTATTPDTGATVTDGLTVSELDHDGDGEVSAAEASESNVLTDDLFDFIDANHDGVLSQFELETYRRQKRNDAERDAGTR